MKRRIIIFFLILMFAISVRGIALDRTKDCGTVAECLQNAVEADNRLAKENSVLREIIKKLQNELNCLIDLAGSIHIPAELTPGDERKIKDVPIVEPYPNSPSLNWGVSHDNNHNNLEILVTHAIEAGRKTREHVITNTNKINEIIKEIEVINNKISVIVQLMKNSKKLCDN